MSPDDTGTYLPPILSLLSRGEEVKMTKCIQHGLRSSTTQMNRNSQIARDAGPPSRERLPAVESKAQGQGRAGRVVLGRLLAMGEGRDKPFSTASVIW